MAHRVVIRIEAEVDMTDAAIWYEGKRPALGREFLAAVHAAIVVAAANPFKFPCLRRRPDVRRVLVRRFPYRVFFIRRVDTVVNFRVIHASRHDRHWKSNVPKE